MSFSSSINRSYYVRSNNVHRNIARSTSNPYPIHRNMYLQQQRDQERRRQNLNRRNVISQCNSNSNNSIYFQVAAPERRPLTAVVNDMQDLLSVQVYSQNEEYLRNFRFRNRQNDITQGSGGHQSDDINIESNRTHSNYLESTYHSQQCNSAIYSGELNSSGDAISNLPSDMFYNNNRSRTNHYDVESYVNNISIPTRLVGSSFSPSMFYNNNHSRTNHGEVESYVNNTSIPTRLVSPSNYPNCNMQNYLQCLPPTSVEHTTQNCVHPQLPDRLHENLPNGVSHIDLSRQLPSIWTDNYLTNDGLRSSNEQNYSVQNQPHLPLRSSFGNSSALHSSFPQSADCDPPPFANGMNSLPTLPNQNQNLSEYPVTNNNRQYIQNCQTEISRSVTDNVHIPLCDTLDQFFSQHRTQLPGFNFQNRNNIITAINENTNQTVNEQDETEIAELYGNVKTYEEYIKYRAVSLVHRYCDFVNTTKPDITDSCTICLSNFIVDLKVVTLPCKHRFHKKCILLWVERSCACPLCRKDIRKYDSVVEQLEEPSVEQDTNTLVLSSDSDDD